MRRVSFFGITKVLLIFTFIVSFFFFAPGINTLESVNSGNIAFVTSPITAEAGLAQDIVTGFAAGLINNVFRGAVFVLGMLAWVALFLTSFLVGVSETFLNVAIELSTSGFSEMMNGGVGVAIKAAWETFRDLASIGLIFILLYIAISTIINAGNFQTKKLLGATILVALAINFSYFAAAVVIDISNTMAISIHESVEKKIKNSGAEHLGDFIRKESKQDRIKQALPTSDPSRGSNQAPNSIMNSMVANILLVVLNVVMIIVFLIAAIMLITRVIILMFVLVLAPIGFVSSILPNTGKMAKEWWSTLISNAFFLPVFLLFILVAVEIIGSGGLDSLEKIATNAAGSGGGGFGAQQTQSLLADIKTVMGPLVQYSIVIGLFIAALVASRKMSMGGGGIASKVSGSITTSIGRGAIGAGAFAGRNTIGRAASTAADSERFKNFAARSTMGNMMYQGTKGVAASSFDARGSRAFKGVGAATGITNDFGKVGGKGGYNKSLDDSVKAKEKYSKDLGEAELSPEEQVQALQLETNASNLTKDAKQAAKDGDMDMARQFTEDASKASKEASDMRNKRQADYAKQLENRLLTKLGNKGGWIGRSNRKGAKAVTKAYRKNKDKKAIDDLKSALGGGGDKKDEE